jgi:hypothetical protein
MFMKNYFRFGIWGFRKKGALNWGSWLREWWFGENSVHTIEN